MEQFEYLKKIVFDEIKYDNSLNILDDMYNIELPIDYKLMLQVYNKELYFNNFIYVLNLYNEFDKVAEMCFSYRISKSKFPNDFLHSVYPDKNGILPCAVTDNGDEIYWLTSNDIWTLIIYESRMSNYYKYNMTISEFIYRIINKEIICPIFPEDL